MKKLDKKILIGRWITEYINQYLKENKEKQASKVLLKIDNISYEYAPAILTAINDAEEKLSQKYHPLLKTVTPIEGYENFSCKDHETSVWLRNFVKPGQVLILILNKKTPEAQSLKDIVSIDESQLLAPKGFDALINMLIENEIFNISEVGILKTFLKAYQKITDSQLSLILNFLEAIINSDSQLSISEKIGINLNCLRLFREKNIRIDNKEILINTLKKNYFLSNLRKNNSVYLDPQKIILSVNRFIENEQNSNFSNEIWSIIGQDESLLLDKVQNFINRKNNELLEISLNTAENLFGFKHKNTIKDRLLNVREQVMIDATSSVHAVEEEEKTNAIKIKEEKEKRYDEGMLCVLQKNDLEEIRAFRNEFASFLEEEGLTKTIINIENKLENPSIYNDLLEGLFSELLVMLEKIEHENFTGNINFVLKKSSKETIPSVYVDFFNYHLNSLSLLSKNIVIEKIKKSDGEENVLLPEAISFDIEIMQNEKIISKTEFYIDTSCLDIKNNSFFDFFNDIQEGENIGYICVEQQKHVKYSFDSILNELTAQTELSDKKLLNHIKNFEQFQSKYALLVKKSIKDGINNKLLKDIVTVVDNFLDHSYEDVNAVRKIYGLINQIGVTDYIDFNSSSKKVSKKVISLFNPLRFISYMYKLIHFGNLVAELSNTSYNHNKVRSIEDIQQYKIYQKNKTSHLAPGYLSGDYSNYFFEQEESYGEGIYTTEEYKESDSNQANNFSEEISKIAQDYIRVYPYSSDCLDILFLYVTNLDYVKKSIEKLFKKNVIKKLNITIHSPSKSGVLYDELNQWLSAKEEYVTPISNLGGLPRLELSVLPHTSEQGLEEKLLKSMTDFDIAIFVDYFGQKNNLNIPKSFFSRPLLECNLEDEDWFKVEETSYRSTQDGTRLINYISQKQPKIFMKFYDLQYVIQSGISVNKNDATQVLQGQIQVTQTEKNDLYNLVHDKFNWVVTYDKYMDPTLVTQVTDKANIIRYHIDKKGRDEVKILVSSSESVKRYIDKNNNYYYHERLSNRIKDLLNIKNIEEETVRNIIYEVKKLSGASVLRSLGPGKFVHELLSVYLTTTNESIDSKGNQVVIWTMCDELDWFRKNQKRPDLLKTTIQYNNQTKKYKIEFKLIELKLVHYNSYESEVIDAEKQLDQGEKTLLKYFDLSEIVLDQEVRLESLKKLLLEARAYNQKELNILENLNFNKKVDFEFKKEIHAYIYSQDVNFENKNNIDIGKYENKFEINRTKIKTFTRSYILKALKIKNDLENISSYTLPEESINFKEFILNSSIEYFLEDPNLSNKLKENEEKVGKGEIKEYFDKETSIKVNNYSNDQFIDNKSFTEREKNLYMDLEKNSDIDFDQNFPEILALQNLEIPVENNQKKMEDKKQGDYYSQVLKTKLNINKIEFIPERVVVGANIIRVIGNIPPTQSFSLIEKKIKDMALWLKIDNPPNVFNDKNGINIDINRPDPETILFSEFMKYVRKQFSSEKLKKDFLVPIGLNPLNDVMYIDLSGTEPHMLVAGSTGSGKSVSLKSIVLSLMCLYSPKELQFGFIDPKKVEFMSFKELKHVMKVLTDINDAADFLDDMVIEMERRYSLFSEKTVENLNNYNIYVTNDPDSNQVLPRIIIVFDEFADFMLRDKEFSKRIENTISRIGQKGRAAGIHMIVCTQSPKAEIINTTIKNNLLARLGLKVTDAVASNVVLDTSGAEYLAGKGDYLLKKDRSPVRGKSPYLEHQSYQALMKFFKK